MDQALHKSSQPAGGGSDELDDKEAGNLETQTKVPAQSDRRSLRRACGAVPDLEHFARRLLTHAISEAESDYWRRRAATFEQARPRRGDFHGRATREELAAADARLARVAQACRKRAAIAVGVTS